jgi:hypothetical protein
MLAQVQNLCARCWPCLIVSENMFLSAARGNFQGDASGLTIIFNIIS